MSDNLAGLWQECAAGDVAAREAIIEGNLSMVYWLAGRYRGRGVDWDDLCQAGAIGLVKAVDNFRPELGNQFSTYAVPMIMGELRRVVRGGAMLHISRGMREVQVRLQEAAGRLREELGREPKLSELASAAGLAEQEAAEALAAGCRPLSLEGGAGEEEGGLLECMAAAAGGEDEWADDISLREAMARLSARAAYILRARYIKEETQSAVAGRLGISQVQVSRLERQALSELRKYLTA